MMTALKQAMKYQNYALANSNAMDGHDQQHPPCQRAHLV